jgi:hypothetical protein
MPTGCFQTDYRYCDCGECPACLLRQDAVKLDVKERVRRAIVSYLDKPKKPEFRRFNKWDARRR